MNRKKMFTLIEMIAVIVTLGILAAIVVMNVSSQTKEATAVSIQKNIQDIQTAVDTYRLKHNDGFPTKEDPTLTKPVLLDFETLYPKYLKKTPNTKEQNYWVDAFGKVWGSTIPAVDRVESTQDSISWKTQEKSIGYQVFVVENAPAVSGAANKEFSMKVLTFRQDQKSEWYKFPKKENTTYLVSSVDSFGLPTAPVGIGSTSDMIIDEMTGLPILMPLDKLGTYTVTVGGKGLYRWMGVEKEEIKPAGSDIVYSFATSDDGKNFTDFSSNLEDMKNAAYLKVKIELKGKTGENPIRPTLKKFKVLFERVNQAENEFLPPFAGNVQENHSIVIGPESLKLADGATDGYASFVFAFPSRSYISGGGAGGSGSYGDSTGGSTGITYQAMTGNGWSNPVSHPSLLPATSQVKMNVTMSRDSISQPSPVVEQAYFILSPTAPKISSLDENDQISPEALKSPVGESFQTIDTFEMYFMSQDNESVEKVETKDFQPNGTRIRYIYSTSTDNSTWGDTTEKVEEIKDAPYLRVQVVREKTATAKEEPQFFEIQVIYRGTDGTSRTSTKTGSNNSNIQAAIDKYYLAKGQYPTVQQPTSTTAALIDFNKLYPDYLAFTPTYTDYDFWVDSTGGVWSSSAAVPSNLQYSGTTLTWAKSDGAASYQVYEKQSGATGSLVTTGYQMVKKTTGTTFTGQGGSTYMVTALDGQGNETAPSAPITIPANQSPIPVITMTPETNLTTNTSIAFSWSNSTDPNGDTVVAAEWMADNVVVTTPPAKYTQGKHTVSLRVKDSKGLWSNWIAKEFTVDAVPIDYTVGASYDFTQYVNWDKTFTFYNVSKSQPLNFSFYSTAWHGYIYSDQGVSITITENGTTTLNGKSVLGNGSSTMNYKYTPVNDNATIKVKVVSRSSGTSAHLTLTYYKYRQ